MLSGSADYKICAKKFFGIFDVSYLTTADFARRSYLQRGNSCQLSQSAVQRSCQPGGEFLIVHVSANSAEGQHEHVLGTRNRLYGFGARQELPYFWSYDRGPQNQYNGAYHQRGR